MQKKPIAHTIFQGISVWPSDYYWNISELIRKNIELKSTFRQYKPLKSLECVYVRRDQHPPWEFPYNSRMPSEILMKLCQKAPNFLRNNMKSKFPKDTF